LALRTKHRYKLKMTRTNFTAALVVLVGLIRLFGYLTGIDSIRNLGVFTVASPLPLVFTDRGDYEDFATEYTVVFFLKGGKHFKLPVTSEFYSSLDGPFDRRGTYSKAFFYLPFLRYDLWKSIIGFGFCENGPLARGLKLKEEISRLLILVSTKTKGKERTFLRELECDT